jgi:hypothetical protein
MSASPTPCTKEKPQEFFKPWDEGCGRVSVSCAADGTQTITRGGETYVVRKGEEDPYGTVYTGPLYSYYALEWNILLLKRFSNECIVNSRVRKGYEMGRKPFPDKDDAKERDSEEKG